MSATETLKRIGRSTWVVVRFVLFGFVGYLVMLCGSVLFIDRVLGHGHDLMSPFLSFPLALVGAVMMLYGTGEWGRWAFLWVFLAIPLCLFVLLSIPGSGPKESEAIFAGVAVWAIYFGVRAYYKRKAPAESQKDEHIAN